MYFSMQLHLNGLTDGGCHMNYGTTREGFLLACYFYVFALIIIIGFYLINKHECDNSQAF